MSERRQVPRYLFNGVAQLSQAPEGLTANITLVTIGVKGCRTESGIALTVGQKCMLSVDWQGRTFRTEVEVAWKNPKGGAGLRFLSVDRENLAVLRNICVGLQLEPLTINPPEPGERR